MSHQPHITKAPLSPADASKSDIATAVGRFLGSVAAIVAGGLATVLLVTALLEPTEAVMVIGPQDRAFAAIVEGGGLVVEQGDGFTVGRGTGPGFARALYAAGAWAVLPSLGGGCATTPFGVPRSGRPPQR